MVERYGFLGAWAPPPASPRFAGCTPTSTANTARWCMALRRAPRERIDRLGGLNKPHVSFGKIQAQAYDTAAYKCAADDLLLGHGTEFSSMRSAPAS